MTMTMTKMRALNVTATSAQFVSPKDRKISELLKILATMTLHEISFVLETARGIEKQRLEAESRSQRPDYNPDPDPHGV